jgi:WD40 repeat protein
VRRCILQTRFPVQFRNGTVLVLGEAIKSALICSTLVVLAVVGRWPEETETKPGNESIIQVEPPSTKPIHNLSVSDDEQVRLTVHCGGVLRIQHADPGIPDRTLSNWSWKLTSAMLSPDGETVVVALYDGSIVFLPTRNPDELRTASARHADYARSLAISNDGKLVASAGSDGVMVWDLESRELLDSYNVSQPVQNVRFSPTGNRLAVVSGNFGVHILDLRDGRRLLGYRHDKRVVDAVFAGNDDRVVSIDENGTLTLREVDREAPCWTLEERWSAVLGLSVSRDGRLAAVSGGWQHGVHLIALDQGALLGNLTGHEATPSYLWFSPDRRRLYSAGHDGLLRIWDIAHDPRFQPESKSQFVYQGDLFPPEATVPQ